MPHRIHSFDDRLEVGAVTDTVAVMIDVVKTSPSSLR